MESSVHSFANVSDTSLVLGLCDKAHYHHQRKTWSNAPLHEWSASLQANAFDRTFQTEALITSRIYCIKRCPCDVPFDIDYAVNSNTLVFGLCDKAHYHNIKPNIPHAPPITYPLPESLQTSEFNVTYQTEVPITAKIYYIKKCPIDVRSSNIGETSSQNLSSSINGNCDEDGVIPKTLFNSIQKKQDELLNNFKKETDTIIKNFKRIFVGLNLEVSAMSNTINTNCAQLRKFGEQVEELECKIEELLPESTASGGTNTSSSQSEEDEDILKEIEIIKQSNRTFMDYRPLTGQHWETSKPVTFEVTIRDTTLYAIYDARVAKSVMSDDILFSDDETEELDYDKVFYVPWWFPKLQTCRDEGTVDVLINTYYSHSLKVAFNPYWNKTVVLGFNFGQKFIDNVNEDSGIITLRDDAGCSYNVNFEYYYT